MRDWIPAAQREDPEYRSIIDSMPGRADSDFSVTPDGMLRFRGRIVLPDQEELRKALLTEAHNSWFNVHPGATKMYRDLRENFWWRGMKKHIAEFVAQCLVCQQVKAEHQRPAGKLQPLPIPEWKWEHITMDFVTGLPTTRNGHDAVWVIVDRLTKSAYFLPVKVTFSLERLARLYMREIIRLHGTPVSIVSDRDPRFVSRFWGALHKAFGTRLSFSTAYHPQTDGQSERTIQTLEDMLRACALEWKGNWDDQLPLMEFSYNNSHHSSIDMAPYEALYGRRCRSPSCWYEVGERQMLGPDLVDDATQKISLIREKLLTAQSRQKSYADHRRRELEFDVGDKVLLKVSPWRGTIRFGRKGSLAPFHRTF
ncbi:hypothetical protein Dimus_038102 [Dionaea muscipula]